MKLKRNLSTPESRELWNFVDETRRVVEQWPDWMRGAGSYASSSSPPRKRAPEPKPETKKRG